MKIHNYDGNSDDHIRFCEVCNFQVDLDDNCPNCENDKQVQEEESLFLQTRKIFEDYKLLISLI